MMLPATKMSLTTPPWMKKFGIVASNVLCNFIHFQHFLSWTGSRGVTGVYPNWLRAEGRIHFELVASQSQGTERDRRTFTPTYTPSPIPRWPYTSPACVPLHHQRFPTQFQFSKKFIGLLVLHLDLKYNLVLFSSFELTFSFVIWNSPNYAMQMKGCQK